MQSEALKKIPLKLNEFEAVMYNHVYRIQHFQRISYKTLKMELCANLLTIAIGLQQAGHHHAQPHLAVPPRLRLLRRQGRGALRQHLQIQVIF